MLIGVLVALAFASSGPTPRWVAAHTGDYQVRVQAGQTLAVTFPDPTRPAGADRPISFAWRVIRPSHPPAFLLFEHCQTPERCLPTVMRPTGESRGTTGVPVRIVNRSNLAVDIAFRYTIWRTQ